MKQFRSSIALIGAMLGITVALVVVVNLARAGGFTLTINKVGQGQVNANPLPPYVENQMVTLTAVPDSGWKFVGWSEAGDQGNWWDSQWDYRVPVTFSGNGFQRQNKPAEVEINFNGLISSLGEVGTLDPNSIRVVEVDENGVVIDDDVAFQYDVKQELNDKWNPQKNPGTLCSTPVPGTGTVTLIMKGTTGANQSRYYHIYFDVPAKGIPAKVVTPQITFTDNVIDPPAPDPGRQASFKVETQAGTYYYHKQGAGFSSLDDAEGYDWINYNGYHGSGFGGEYRGIPNMVLPSNGGLFHPGSKDKKLASCLLSTGPLKTSIYSIHLFSNTDKWMVTWDILPTYAQMEVLAARYDYWFLYEGTPGGTFEGNSDFSVRSDGTTENLSKEWSTTLSPEQWVYFADPTLGRSLFATQHDEDAKTDSYVIGGTNQMTVFGFGRSGAQSLIPKTLVPEQFTVGLIETTDLNEATGLIHAAYKDLSSSTGEPELYSGSGSLGNTNPLQVAVTGDRVITATFAPQTFELNLTADGQGTVSKTPNQALYNYNDQVQINATPTNPDWRFARWEGDTTGLDPLVAQQMVTMTMSRSLTAVFSPVYTIETTPVGEGSITLDPDKLEYYNGDEVTVTAVPEPGWSFAGWSGGATGTTNPLQIVVSSDLSITGTFTQDEYTLTVDSVGPGTADWSPKKATYLYGDTVDLTATPDLGSTFMGWTGTISSFEASHQIVITGDTTATANFAEVSFRTLTVEINGEGSATKNPDKAEYQVGESVSLTATPDAGWIFNGWTGALISNENPGTLIIPDGVEDTVTVTANFIAAGPFTLNVNQEGSGSVTTDPLKTEYIAGETVTLTPVPAQGWVFANWKGDLSGSANPAIVTMDSNKAITAVFVQPGASGALTDNFDNCTLGSNWAFVNPLGDGSYNLNGTQLRLSVPAGVAHEVYTGGNNGVRVVQETLDEDFTFYVKFMSPLTVNGTGQGVVVEQDAQNFIRYEVYRKGDKVTLYALRLENLVPISPKTKDIAPPGDTLYLRVNRVGDKWILDYSFDGTTWNDGFKFDSVMVASKVGPYSSNFAVKGVIPAFTAAVDTFYNPADATPVGDLSLLTVTTNGNGQVQRNAQAPYTCGQSVQLTAVANAGGQFDGWTGDATGSQNPLTVLLDARKNIVANFVGGAESFTLALPMVVAP